jgi:sugar phosphate permease
MAQEAASGLTPRFSRLSAVFSGSIFTSFGTTRIRIWGVLALVYVVSYFHRIAPAVLAKDLMAGFGATGVEIATMAALYLYSFALMQPLGGALLDSWGPRKTVAAGAALMGGGALIFAAARVLSLAYFSRILVGIGASVVFIGTLKVVSSWFRTREFATMSGLTQVAGHAGGLLASAPLTWTVASLGWRATFTGMAVISAALALLTMLVVRDRPEDAGHPSPAARDAHREGLPAPPARATVSWREGFRVVWKNPRTWPMFFVFFLQYGSLLAFSGLWGVPFLRDVYGMSPAKAAGVVSAIPIGVMIGAPLVGFLSDRLERRRMPYFLFLAAYTAVWAVLALPAGGPPAAWLTPLCFVFGATATGFTLTWALAREVNPPRYSGIAIATVNAGGFLGAAVMQNAVGKVLDAGWTGVIEAGARRYPPGAYRSAFLLCFAVTALAAVLSLTVAETHGRTMAE